LPLTEVNLKAILTVRNLSKAMRKKRLEINMKFQLQRRKFN
jgi:hypothetical protein